MSNLRFEISFSCKSMSERKGLLARSRGSPAVGSALGAGLSTLSFLVYSQPIADLEELQLLTHPLSPSVIEGFVECSLGLHSQWLIYTLAFACYRPRLSLTVC